MTKAELIAILESVPDDAKVVVWDNELGDYLYIAVTEYIEEMNEFRII